MKLSNGVKGEMVMARFETRQQVGQSPGCLMEEHSRVSVRAVT